MNRLFAHTLTSVAALVAVGCSSQSVTQSARLLIGTSTQGASEGLYLYTFDFNTLEAEPLSSTEIENPTFVAVGDEKLFSVVENVAESAAVVSYNLDAESGKFDRISSQKVEGDYPCHILRGDGWVGTANYGGGSISLFAVAKDGVVSQMRQYIEFNRDGDERASHLHCLIPSPDDKMLFATDLGMDSIYRFRVSAREEIVAGGAILEPIYPSISVERGSGPRHMTFAPNGKRAYLITELKGAVVAYDFDGEMLSEFQTIQSDSVGGGGCADIHISSDGRFLYSSNRLKDDGISTFAVDETTGRLEKIDYTKTGVHPRNFTLSPDEKYLLVACRDSHSVQIFEREEQSGKLTYLGEEYDVSVDSPMFVKFL